MVTLLHSYVLILIYFIKVAVLSCARKIAQNSWDLQKEGWTVVRLNYESLPATTESLTCAWLRGLQRWDFLSEISRKIWDIFSNLKFFSNVCAGNVFFFLTRVSKFCDFPENLEIGKWLPPKNKTHVNSLIQNGREKTSATSTSQCRPFWDVWTNVPILKNSTKRTFLTGPGLFRKLSCL